MASQKYTYQGYGEVYLSKWNGDTLEKGRVWGNVMQLDLDVETEEDSVPDMINGSGLYSSMFSIKSCKGKAQVSDYSPENLSMALLGAQTDVAAGAITGESHKAYKGGRVFLNHVYDTAVAPVVKKDTTTLVAGTDYFLTASGLALAETTSAFVDGDTITVDYTKKAYSDVQAAMGEADVYQLVFSGINKYQKNRYTCLCHEVKIAPSTLALINSKANALDFDFTLLSSARVQGEGLSKFFRVQVEKL